jgi:hypothetical protein
MLETLKTGLKLAFAYSKCLRALSWTIGRIQAESATPITLTTPVGPRPVLMG